ncbi:adenosine deaminase family protein [Nesterenkonia populi]
MTHTVVPSGWLERIPKVELHCHLIGTVRAETFVELARRENLELPEPPEYIYPKINSKPPDPDLYKNTRIPVHQGPAPDEPTPSYSLFQSCSWVTQLLRAPEDLTRITYEAFEAARASNVLHLELFIDQIPDHLEHLGYAGYVEAMAEGIRAAEREFGMTGRLIAGIDRSKTGEDAVAWVRQVVDNPHPYLVGVGLDNLENAGPPERFIEAYQLAASAGLGRTAHSSEHVPSAHNTITCLDQLGCNRIDHGYYVLEDDSVVARLQDDQTVFTVGCVTSRRSWRPWRRASIRAMLDAGLAVVPCSDDPGMFPNSMNNEYRILAEEVGATHEQLRAMALRAVDACWLPMEQKATLRKEVEAQITALDDEFALTLRGGN